MGMKKNLLHVTLFIVLFLRILPTKCQEDRKVNTESIVGETSTSTTIFNDLSAGETEFLGEEGVVEFSKSVTIVNVDNVNTERAEVMKDFIQTIRTNQDLTTVRTITTNLEIEKTNYVDLLDNKTLTVPEIPGEIQSNTTERIENATETKNFNEDNDDVIYDEIYEESSSKYLHDSDKEIANLNGDEAITVNLVNSNKNIEIVLTTTESINKFEESEDNEKDLEEEEENASIIPETVHENIKGNKEEDKGLTQEESLSTNSEVKIEENNTGNEDQKEDKQRENYSENEGNEKNQENQTEFEEIIATTNSIMTTQILIGENQEIERNEQQNQDIDKAVDNEKNIFSNENNEDENNEENQERNGRKNEEINTENTSSNLTTLSNNINDSEDENSQKVREENGETKEEGNTENTSSIFATATEKNKGNEDENNQEVTEENSENYEESNTENTFLDLPTVEDNGDANKQESPAENDETHEEIEEINTENTSLKFTTVFEENNVDEINQEVTEENDDKNEESDTENISSNFPVVAEENEDNVDENNQKDPEENDERSRESNSENTSSNLATVADQIENNEDENSQEIPEENGETKEEIEVSNTENTPTNLVTVADQTKNNEDENSQEIPEENGETNEEIETPSNLVRVADQTENNEDENNLEILGENGETNEEIEASNTENTPSNLATVADQTENNEGANSQEILEENSETKEEIETPSNLATVADEIENNEDEDNQEILEENGETNEEIGASNTENTPLNLATVVDQTENNEDEEIPEENSETNAEIEASNTENTTSNLATVADQIENNEQENIQEILEDNGETNEEIEASNTENTPSNLATVADEAENNHEIPENEETNAESSETLENSDNNQENDENKLENENISTNYVTPAEEISEENKEANEELIEDNTGTNSVQIQNIKEENREFEEITEETTSDDSQHFEISEESKATIENEEMSTEQKESTTKSDFLEEENEETSSDLVIRIIFPEVQNVYSKEDNELSTEIGSTTVIENQPEINYQNEENHMENLVKTTNLESINSAEFDEIETTSHLDYISETTTTIIDIWLAEKNKTRNITEEILTTTEVIEDVTLSNEDADMTTGNPSDNPQQESFETTTVFTEFLSSSVEDNEETTNNLTDSYVTSTSIFNDFQENTDQVTDTPQIEVITSAEDATGSTIFSKEMVDNGQFTADAINILKEDTTENVNLLEENLHIDSTTNEDILTFEVTSPVTVFDATTAKINEEKIGQESINVENKEEPEEKILEKSDKDPENNKEEYDLNEEYAEEIKSIDDLFAEYAAYTSTEDQFQKDAMLTTDSVISSMKELEDLENPKEAITPNEVSDYVTTSTNDFEDYKDVSTESKETNEEKELFSKHVFKTYIDRTTTEKVHILDHLPTAKIDEDILKEEITNTVEHLLIDRDLRKNSSANDKKNWQTVNLNELVEETEDTEDDQDEYVENKRKFEHIAEEVEKIKTLEKELTNEKYDVSYSDPGSTNYYDEDYTSSEGFNSTESIYTDHQVNTAPYVSIGQNAGDENCLQGNISMRIFIGEHSLQAPENSTIFMTCSRQSYYLKVSWRNEEHEKLNNTVSFVIEFENNTYFIESVEVIHDDNTEVSKSSKRQLRILETSVEDVMIGNDIIDFENGYQLELVDVNLIPKKLLDYSETETASQAKPIFDKMTIIIISTSAGVCSFVLLVVGIILYKKISTKTTIYKMTIE